MPAILYGLVEVEGPIDEEDRIMARMLLEITETRARLAEFLRQRKVHSDIHLLLVSPEGMKKIDKEARADIHAQVENLRISPSRKGKVPDELWRYVQEVRRPWAEGILRGVLPGRANP